MPLGGAGEIGMNMYCYGHAGQWMLVDCGISFAHDGIPGIDVLMPDPEFIFERKRSLAGLVITHAHEDHIGAIPYVIEELGCPVYATRFTAAMIKTKLEEAGLTRSVALHIIEPLQNFSVGGFVLRYVPLTHSIPDNHALLIDTKIGRVFHSGDWKFDSAPVLGEPTDVEMLKSIGDAGVLAMTCDSTNVFEPGHSGSESEVVDGLKKAIKSQTGRVAVTLFASNLARMQTVARAAAACQRKVLLAGRSLHRVYDIALELELIEPFANLVDEDESGSIPDDKILYICTGCQGERLSALAKISAGTHPFIKLGQGDSVIFSSREIPGNDISIQRMQNALARQGVHIITPDSFKVHVSGHPYRDELTEMYRLIRPKVAIPMHGELRHLLTHQELAQNSGIKQSVIAENGQMIRITKSGAEPVAEISTGTLALDGAQWIDIHSEVLKDKHKFNWNGAMVISVVMDKKGQLATDPQISLMGIVENDQLGDVIADMVDEIEKSLRDLPKSDRSDDKKLAERIRIAAQRVVQSVCGKKPLGRVHILRL